MKTHNPRRLITLISALAVLSLALGACNLEAPAPPEQEATASPFVFPTATQPAASGSISGVVWHDLCDAPGEGEAPPDTPPTGCTAAEEGGFRADGVLAEGEPGIGGLTVRLGEGGCPAFGLASTTTDADGAYQFEGLQGGSYCVSVDASAEGNSDVLIPGQWTFPAGAVTSPSAGQTVSIETSGVLDDVNFGWDHQFLPGGTPTPTPEASATPEATATAEGDPTATLDPADPKAGLGEPRFEDQLNSAANWGLYSNDQVEFTLGDGRLNMRALQADFTDWWTLAGPQVDDFYVEGTLGMGECAGRDEVGLVVRSSNIAGDWVGYLFALTCDGRYGFRIWDGETMTKLVSETPSEFITAGPNQEHTMGLMARGDVLSLYVNGNLLTEVTDDTYESGLVGVFIGAGNTPGVRGYLDEIRLWDVP